MDFSLSLIASLIINIGLLLIIFGQSKEIQVLRQQNQRAISDEERNELVVLSKEKLNVLGKIKTIKYLRSEKGMSMLDAKNFVDSLQEKSNLSKRKYSN